MTKLIRNDGDVPTIFFPAGRAKFGGSCEFTTRKCRKRCWYDEFSTAVEKDVLKAFKETSASDLLRQLTDEVVETNVWHLQWFASGDCPVDMTTKIAWLIQQLSTIEPDMYQCGFTRNRPLWRMLPPTGKVRFVLTVESMRSAKAMCEEGIVGIPDYDIGFVNLYQGMEKVAASTEEKRIRHCGGCGGAWYSTVTVTRYKEIPKEHLFPANCMDCQRCKRGCFSEIWREDVGAPT